MKVLVCLVPWVAATILAGCGRPAPTWLGPETGLGDGGQDGWLDAAAGDGASIPPDGGPPGCEMRIESCRSTFPGGAAVIEPMTGQFPDVAELSSGNLAVVVVDGSEWGLTLAILRPDGTELSRYPLLGMNLSHIAVDPGTGMALVVTDSVAHWLDASGQFTGQTVDLADWERDGQIGPDVVWGGSGFAVAAGTVTYTQGRRPFPVSVTWLAPGEEPDWTVLEDTGEPWDTPRLAALEDGSGVVVAAVQWEGGSGGVWTVRENGVQKVWDLPGNLPATLFPPLLDVAQFRGRFYVVWQTDDWEANVLVASSDGATLRLGGRETLSASLEVVGGELWAALLRDDGSLVVERLDVDDPSNPVAGRVEVHVDLPGVHGWDLAFRRTSRGVAAAWTSEGSGTAVVNLDCCMPDTGP